MKRQFLSLLFLLGLSAAAFADTRLVLHYDLSRTDDGDVVLTDFSGNGCDGTLMDGASVTTFKKEVVLKNGMKGWVDFGEGFGDIVSQLTDFSVSARLYISTVNKYDRPGYVLLSFTQGDNISLSDKGYFYLGAADAGVHLSTSTVADEQSVTADKGLSAGSWHTFTWTCLGGVVRYYVDGTYQAGGRISLTPQAIGKTIRNRLFSTVNDGDARLASTYLSDFRIYDGALTTAEVCALAGKEYHDDKDVIGTSYSFKEQGLDKLGITLHGSAHLTTEGGWNVVDLGDEDGWVDLGDSVTWCRLTEDNFSIATCLFIPSSTNLSQAGNFVFSFSHAADIHKDPAGCFFLGAGATRYAITPTDYRREQAVQTGLPLEKGIWQHVAYRQKDHIGTLFVNGLPVASDSIHLAPKDIGRTAYNWLGRSCYAGDAYLKGARYCWFSVTQGAPSDESIIRESQLYLDDLNRELFEGQLAEARERLTLDSDILYGDVALPVNLDNGISVEWVSSDETHLTPAGKVTRPVLGEDTARVTLRA